MDEIEELATKGRDYIKKLKERYREGLSEMGYRIHSMQTEKGAKEYNTPYPEVYSEPRYKKGGRVRGAGIARKGVRKCKMR